MIWMTYRSRPHASGDTGNTSHAEHRTQHVSFTSSQCAGGFNYRRSSSNTRRFSGQQQPLLLIDMLIVFVSRWPLYFYLPLMCLNAATALANMIRWGHLSALRDDWSSISVCLTVLFLCHCTSVVKNMHMAEPCAGPLYGGWSVSSLHDSQHASNTSVSNADSVCLFSLSPIPEVNSNMPGELERKTSECLYVTTVLLFIWQQFIPTQTRAVQRLALVRAYGTREHDISVSQSELHVNSRTSGQEVKHLLTSRVTGFHCRYLMYISLMKFQ